MGFVELHALNPRLLYCSISGFGQTGPESGRTAMDPIIQAVSGIMSVTGYPDSGPTAIGAPLADVISGMFGAYAIVGALHAVRQSNIGCHIDVSMQAAMIATLGPRMGGSLNAGFSPERIGNQNPMRAPSDVYRTRDGRHVFLMIHHDRVWAPFCRAVGRPQWIENERYATNRLRCSHRDELNRLVHERFAEFDADDITARLHAERVPCSVVNDYAEAAADPQVMHRKLIQQVVHRSSGPIRVVGVPWLIDGESVQVGPPPALGEHVGEVLSEWLEWPADEIERFRRAAESARPAQD
jgi:crotonobetainyl-CoA:carnitine CoA-transferase CaiB-like acyl-CoA transferase